MEEFFDKIWWVLFLPLGGAIFQALFGGAIVRALGPSRGKQLMGALAVIPIAAAFFAGLGITYQLTQLESNARSSPPIVLFDWISVHGLRIPFEVVVDPLSMTMVLIITGIGALIHLYATGYMAEEKDYTRFFTYLNLFISAMLILVLANNLPLMFIGWEGVGLCSYLLIAFWYKDLNNAKSGNKAFIVNRIGDWGLMLGIFLLVCVMTSYFASSQVGSDQRWLSYDVLLPSAALALKQQPVLATAIALLLFVGACGKSAQFPLYFWLPDAMAGPTPVSALIHAATMVTAGVFMLNRLHLIFAVSPLAMGIVAVVGAFTALFAALIAFGQTDIKKVLAYSTVSQLGFMFTACGVGAFWAGMFHVVTHAFFKALLFLGSGAVIAAMAHDQDMRHYGNLIKYIKITGFTMIVGWLAIAGLSIPGVFGLSGFYSKEAIVGAALDPNSSSFFGLMVSPALGWVLLGVALLTAAYMARLMMLTFFGKEERWRQLAPARAEQHDYHDAHEHPAMHGDHEPHDDPHGFFYSNEEVAAKVEHEHPHGLTPQHTPKEVYPSMWIPLVALGVLSAIGGWALFGSVHSPIFQRWLYPESAIETGEIVRHPVTHATLGWISFGAAMLGILYGVIVYWRGLPKRERSESHWSPFRRAARNQFGYDATVMEAGVEGGGTIANWLWQKVDMHVIDGTYNAVGWLVTQIGYVLRLFQSGFVRSYALLMLVGGVTLLGSFWYALSHMGGPK